MTRISQPSSIFLWHFPVFPVVQFLVGISEKGFFKQLVAIHAAFLLK